MGATTAKEYVVIEFIALHRRALHEERCAFDGENDSTVICRDVCIPSEAICVVFPTKWIALPYQSALANREGEIEADVLSSIAHPGHTSSLNQVKHMHHP